MGQDVSLLLAAFIAAVGAAVWLAVVARRTRRAAEVATAARDTAVERAARAEALAARAEAALLELIGGVPIGIVRLTDDLVVDVVNEPALVALDRERARVERRSAFEAFIDERLVDLVRAAREGAAARIELVRAGAEERVIDARAVRSSTGALWLTLEDVSELRRLQRIRAEFIDNLSHELRTPLTSLGLLSETLARDMEAAAAAGDPVTPRMRDRVDKIQLETGHLTQMVTEMLELSRIEAGAALPATLDDLDMAVLATTSADRLRTFADRSGIRLALDAPEPGVALVRGDPARLGQVLLNLLHNAAKFSPSGSEVVIRVVADGDEVVTSVIDHGIGIPAESQVRIFERFYKVDRARVRGEGGTGLGLAIARHIVEAHDGRIWVESREGAGSTFSFALPAIVVAPRIAEAAVS